jgi:hypothetical protein
MTNYAVKKKAFLNVVFVFHMLQILVTIYRQSFLFETAKMTNYAVKKKAVTLTEKLCSGTEKLQKLFAALCFTDIFLQKSIAGFHFWTFLKCPNFESDPISFFEKNRYFIEVFINISL